MEIALIAPNSLLAICTRFKYQMALPDCIEDPVYFAHYQYFGWSDEFFLILDNGAWETRSISPQGLVDLAWDVHAQEVILPDVMSNDPDDTFAAMDDFFLKVAETEPPWRYSAVIHASSVDQGKEVIDRIASAYPLVSTIALAKRLPRDCVERKARVELSKHVHEAYAGKLECHLLGYNEDIPEEMWATARSMDTTAPFTCAMENISIADSTRVPRPSNYFELPKDRFNAARLRENIRQLSDATILVR